MISRSVESSMLADEMAQHEAGAHSRIDGQTTIDGTVATDADLLVEGRVTGSVTCGGTLYVAAGAEVDARVEANTIVVAGTLSGTVRCTGRLEIQSSGIVRARVDTERLVILEGGVYEGQLRMETPAADVADEPEELEAASPGEEATEPPSPAPTAYSFLRSFTSPPTPAERSGDVPGSDEPDEEP
jgi:cytoskeletal protein CcmA (bactofilin family)